MNNIFFKELKITDEEKEANRMGLKDVMELVENKPMFVKNEIKVLNKIKIDEKKKLKDKEIKKEADKKTQKNIKSINDYLNKNIESIHNFFGSQGDNDINSLRDLNNALKSDSYPLHKALKHESLIKELIKRVNDKLSGKIKIKEETPVPTLKDLELENKIIRDIEIESIKAVLGEPEITVKKIASIKKELKKIFSVKKAVYVKFPDECLVKNLKDSKSMLRCTNQFKNFSYRCKKNEICFKKFGKHKERLKKNKLSKLKFYFPSECSKARIKKDKKQCLIKKSELEEQRKEYSFNKKIKDRLNAILIRINNNL